MELSFKDALTLQREARGLSLGKVAKGAGVSEHILKNVNQGKSEKPNAEAALKIAAFFGVSLQEFYSGQILDASATAHADASDLANELLAEINAFSPDHREDAVRAALATVRAVKAAKS